MNFAAHRSSAGVLPADVPLTDPAALHALTGLVGDHALVDALVSRFSTWSDLASAGPAGLARRTGAWAALLAVPERCPVLPPTGFGVAPLSRYAPGYPSSLLELPDPPVLLFATGSLPAAPALAIGGSHYPSPAGLAHARAAARTCARLSVPVVAALDSGVGQAALEEVVSAGGVCVAVVSCDLAAPSSHAPLRAAVLRLGGAVVSEWGPGTEFRQGRVFAAARLVAALGSAVLLAELGVHPAGGAHLARAAVALARPLVVPAAEPELLVTATTAGGAMLARPRGFGALPFGSNPRLAARAESGLPAADTVIGSLAELEARVAELRAVAG